MAHRSSQQWRPQKKPIALKSSYYKQRVPIVDGGEVFSDGSTMIKILLDIILPSTTVGSANFCKNIQNCCMEKRKDDVKAAMEFVEHNLKEIRQRGEDYDSARLHIFQCLLSTINSRFRGWADCINQDISSDEYKSYTPQIIIDATTPQQAQMMILSTHLMDTKAQLQVAMADKDLGGGAGNDTGRVGGGGGGQSNDPEPWQFT